jgi:hypothetical protein
MESSNATRSDISGITKISSFAATEALSSQEAAMVVGRRCY